MKITFSKAMQHFKKIFKTAHIFKPFSTSMLWKKNLKFDKRAFLIYSMPCVKMHIAFNQSVYATELRRRL